MLQAYDPSVGTQSIGDLWTLTKDDQHLTCSLCTHPLGWELRLIEGPYVMRLQVCKSRAEVFKSADKWKILAIGEDWKPWD